MINIYPKLLAMDDVLAQHDVPPLSDRWREELRAFYEGDYRVHAARVGRGGSKSTTAAKCLTAEVLFGHWRVPAGERHWAINISENLSEAVARLGQIKRYLEILDVPHEKSGEQIILLDLPLGFWSRPARIGAVSGPRCVAWSDDEAAKQDVDGVNPSPETVASLKATTITHPDARGRLYSSPWSTLDYHHQVISAGTTTHTLVTTGASWEYNPTITEEQTHALEPDLATWSREYAAQPMPDAATAFFDSNAIDAAIDPHRALSLPLPRHAITVGAGVDFAFTSDSSAIAVVHQRDGAYDVAELDELRPEPGAPLKPSAVCARFAAVLKRHGAREVLSDAWQRESVSEYLQAAGIAVDAAPAGQGGKVETYTAARVLLHQGMIRMPKHDRLRGQLREVVSRPTTTGLTISSPRRKSGHGDLVSALVLALWAAKEGSPTMTEDGLRAFTDAWSGDDA